MANVSFAQGNYKFNFPKNKTPEQCADWLMKLADKLGDVCYATRFSLFNKERLIHDISSDDNSICVEFDGDGRWNYSNNLEWFETDEELSSLLGEMDGIEITIDYTDYEFGNMFIGAGRALVSYHADTVKVVDAFDSEDLTLESFINYGAGDEEMWKEMMGIDDEEDYFDEDDEEEDHFDETMVVLEDQDEEPNSLTKSLK